MGEQADKCSSFNALTKMLELFNMNVSILFRTKDRIRAKNFRTFREFFRIFRPRGDFFDGPNFFQNLADSAAIRLVQKWSKSEPSSPFFGRLKFRGKFVPCEPLQNFLCGYKIEMVISTRRGKGGVSVYMAPQRPIWQSQSCH